MSTTAQEPAALPAPAAAPPAEPAPPAPAEPPRLVDVVDIYRVATVAARKRLAGSPRQGQGDSPQQGDLRQLARRLAIQARTGRPLEAAILGLGQAISLLERPILRQAARAVRGL